MGARIEDEDKAFLGAGAGEAQERRRQVEQRQIAVVQRRMRLAPSGEAAPGVEGGARVRFLDGDAGGAMVRRHRQPRLAGGKAGMVRVAAPRQRRAAAVAAAEVGLKGNAEKVAQVAHLHPHLSQADLLAYLTANVSRQTQL